MILDYVVPNLAKDRPNVVALNEDVGMMTLATGSRGASTREIFSDPGNVPGCEGIPSPCGVAVALGTLDGEYAEQEAAYDDRFDGDPRLLEDLRRRNRHVRARLDADLQRPRQALRRLHPRLQQPDRVPRVGRPGRRSRSSPTPTSRTRPAPSSRPGPRSTTRPSCGGRRTSRPDGPRPLRNVVASNKKVPLTTIEKLISLTPGPSTGPDAIENVRPVPDPGHEGEDVVRDQPARVRLQRRAGDAVRRGAGARASIPCSDTSKYYMYCLDALGTNLVMQDEANPGEWATQPRAWQPLEWMSSTWRSSADPTVSFDYNVTPHMVGNLADLPFDGQTAITQRGLKGPEGVEAVEGASATTSATPSSCPRIRRSTRSTRARRASSSDSPRGRSRTARATSSARSGAALAPGSGDPRENDYLETAVVADLPYPAGRPPGQLLRLTVERDRCAIIGEVMK